MISIVIPVYNAEQYILQCLDSICQNKNDDIEIIVVDDGSSDASGEIVDDCAKNDKRIKVLHKKNGGVSSARNAGIELATGEWICFIDADDSVTSDFLYVTSLDCKTDLIIKEWEYTSEETNNEKIEGIEFANGELKCFLEKHLDDTVFRTPWAKFFRLDIIKKNNIRFDERFKLGEDNLFVLEYLKYVHQIRVSKEGKYLYKWDNKTWNITPEDSIEYLETFGNLYYALGYKCSKLLEHKLTWYYAVCNGMSSISNWRWYANPMIGKMCWDIKHFYPKKYWPLMLIAKLR